MDKTCNACGGAVCGVCGGCINHGECSCMEDRISGYKTEIARLRAENVGLKARLQAAEQDAERLAEVNNDVLLYFDQRVYPCMSGKARAALAAHEALKEPAQP
jgi:hypothetical protein